jgi:phenylalanine-4-hydroxylase
VSSNSIIYASFLNLAHKLSIEAAMHHKIEKKLPAPAPNSMGMGKTTSYVSPRPDNDGRIAYDTAEHATWHQLYTRQMALLPGRACDEYLEGVAKLGLSPDQVPQLAEVDAALGRATGFGVEAVPALITPKRFFALLARRRFPVATFLRRPEDLDYIEEPDIFHEVFGHCPLLTHPVYADFVQAYGKVALGLPEKLLWRLQRLFWFTVEFGLMDTSRGRRIYGAGILSSFSETPWSLDAPAPRREPFDLVTVLRTPYRIDILQPLYYVLRDWRQLLTVIEQDLPAACAQAKELGTLPPLFPEKAAA